MRDADASRLYLYLLQNSSGGYFSREPVCVDDVRACPTGLDPVLPIPAKAFVRAFKGRSANNSGFLYAVLRHEGLLEAWPEAAHQHLLSEANWGAWAAALKAQPATVFEPAVKAGAAPAAQSEPDSQAEPETPSAAATAATEAPGTPPPEPKPNRAGRQKTARQADPAEQGEQEDDHAHSV
ncbi:MAG: hypothetical protein KF778_01550 [Rhodocyclaceae bacterium]|nr:hypothetical protein [Rhodocyclaceae bacterium]